MMKLLSRTFACFFLFATLSVTVQAQGDIQSPSEFLGYELGSQWTPHHKVMDYFWHVAETSSMVEAKEYGESYEGRQLMLAFVSNTENMNQLEEIRTNNLKRTGLLDGEPSADTTAIVWLSYNVHGNETSSSEAAMKTIYELVHPENAETKSWLQNTVVIMDPMLNPDGRERYVNWFQQTVGEEFNAQVEAREHHEPWPNGRTNHYYFDLNRDWAWLTQKESRQRVEEYQEWMPHVHVDFHEQGYDSPYYFAPAAKPFHNAITDWQSDFQYAIGKNNAKYFDENSWLYFTREVFDLFYPSYGDTYPTFNGAIGMTYEQAGHSMAGLGVIQAEGDTLTLDDRLTHHFTTGLSTIEISSQNADRLVSEFSDYYRTARSNPQGEYKTFVIKADNNPDKLQALFDLLDEHQIDYGKATRERTMGGYNYRTGGTERIRVTEDDYLVSVHQPKGVMARILFEPRPELTDSVTYDITAWEQHYAYGIEGYALKQQLEVNETSFSKEDIDNAFDDKPYAYLARWEGLADVQLLTDLLKNDIKVRFASEEFKIDDRMYGRGTLIITRADNKKMGERFDNLVQKLASKNNQQIYGAETGFVQSGPDFGSSSVRYLKKPRVALLAGEGTSLNRVGEVWHYFDRQINYPITLLDTGYFDEVDLDNYDVLILPSAFDGDVLDDERFQEVREWIASGGKLIAVKDANNMLVDKDGFGLKWKEDKADSTAKASDDKLDRYGDQQREYISGSNSGSVYEISMDTSHPLAFGYEDSYFSLKLDADAYSYLDNGWNVGVAKEDAHMSGFVGYKAEEELENTLTFGVQNMGQGSVVYMVDNPLFRAFWYNGKLLFGNAVFMVGQ
ncbi:zinc carboxypeptidase [Aliifodinibius salipaludis]|uniref:Zinc carboxypeptidase n=1 Tax=Fodinibius salipaludis TaxID=2032627 RepID=A0A2A2GB84_9BACT|nr:M14 family metallopeptidase [Aliifodinibius salipaludis]PAU94113.1 zinc carboxypeptidase [Aliifodinibius salipaludis]